MDRPDKYFEQLVERHKAAIYSVCLMYASNRHEADDIFQEVLVNIWKGLKSYKGADSERSGKFSCRSNDIDSNVMKSWIYRIALNTCISYKRKKRIKTEPLDLSPDIFQPDTVVGKQTETLHRRITRLEPIDRAIVLLWLEAMPYDEIGEIVGLEPKNVGVRLIRIKEKLKKMKDDEK